MAKDISIDIANENDEIIIEDKDKIELEIEANEKINKEDFNNKEWKPNDDMEWAKQVCINDTQEEYKYKILFMIGDGYTYHNIKVPSGGAVRTSDGQYYTKDTKHIWNDEYVREPEYYKNIKLRWMMIYCPEQQVNIELYSDVIYVIIDGLKIDANIFSGYSMLEYFEFINGGEIISTNFSYMFEGCYSLKTIPEIDTLNGTDFSYMFSKCYSLQNVPELNTSNGIYFTSMFESCNLLQKIIKIDLASSEDTESMFTYCINLEYINIINISRTLDLSDSSLYSYETLVNLLNNLIDLSNSQSEYMYLGLINLKKLTDNDKLIATNKNWILE